MRYGGYVYILASGRAGTLYIGVTNDLERRMQEHRHGLVPGFTKRYGVDRLVWFEGYIASKMPSPARNASRNGTAPGSST
jgi:predicted GIY-YIG superfamily endonuclease